MPQRTSNLTLADAVIPGAGLLRQASVTGALREALLIVGFSVFTALCAQIALWIGPVPITGQTLAVLLAGAALGAKRGALSQLAYLGEGLLGLPVFAGGLAGPAVLMGPRGGYLLGFVAAAFAVGWLAQRGWDRHPHTTAAAMLAGNVAIYLLGLPWLALALPSIESVDKLPLVYGLLNFSWLASILPLGLARTLVVGLLPFVVGDLVKLAIAAAVLPSAWALVRRAQPQ